MPKNYQPISHLKQYDTYIKPVLKSGRSVTLIQNGKPCSVIMPYDLAKSTADYLGEKFTKYIKKIANEPSYSLDEAEKIVKNS